jgi:hypothetical protein
MFKYWQFPIINKGFKVLPLKMSVEITVGHWNKFLDNLGILQVCENIGGYKILGVIKINTNRWSIIPDRYWFHIN